MKTFNHYWENDKSKTKIPKHKNSLKIAQIRSESKGYHRPQTQFENNLQLININEIDNHCSTEETTTKNTSIRILKEQIDILLNKIPPREKYIIEEIHGYNTSNTQRTLDWIGKDLDISRERTRQLLCRGLNNLRQLKDTRKLKSY